MVKKYRMVRVPMEAVKGFEAKQSKMEKNIKCWTGKVVKIPMTKVLTFVATNPSEISENKIINVVRKKVRRVRTLEV